VDRPGSPRGARLAVVAGFLVFGGWHWMRLEQPGMSAAALLLLGALGAAPPLVASLGHRRLAWLGCLPVAIVAAIGVTTRTWPWEHDHAVYPLRVTHLVVAGLRDWFGTHTPIDAGRFAGADHDLRLAFFAAAMALTWLIVCRGMALGGIGVAFALFALPSTVLPLHAAGFRAGVFLVLALLTLVVTSDRAERWMPGDAQVVGLTLAVVIAGLVVGTAPGVTKNAFLAWQTWNPLARQAKRVSVDYVWNQTYAPLHWPKKRTTVLEVTSKTPMYWKAATLNTFLIDHWELSPQDRPVATSNGGSLGVPSGDLPIQQSIGNHQVSVKVKVLALADDHLVGAAQPVRWFLPGGVESLLDADGTVTTLGDPKRNTTYSVSVYDPNATPGQLDAAGTGFPGFIRDSIVVGNVTLPAWPSRRPSDVAPLSPDFMTASAEAWQASRAYKATNEYEAVVALENYFRQKPFTYDLTPHYRRGVPALVDFMIRSHRGYCQTFSGAMALVLRLHGIPARVAVGFLPGKPATSSSDTYIVNDHDAHAWVEVYFPQYGWIPFEPTPGSHLPSPASTSDPKFRQLFVGLPPQVKQILDPTSSNAQINPNTAGRVKHLEAGIAGFLRGGTEAGHGAGGGSSHGRFVTWLLTISAALLAALLALKAASVRWRYLRRGPRAQAAAAYRDLVTFVGDQGVEVRPDDTFDDLALRLQETLGVNAHRFASSASLARYAPLSTAGPEARALRRELRAVKREVRTRLTPRERARGALRIRSALSQTTLRG
jgi:Transglutaminase-like superfamily/TgpA N-terminal domain